MGNVECGCQCVGSTYSCNVVQCLRIRGNEWTCFFFFQAEDGIRDLVRSRGLGDVYKRQHLHWTAPGPSSWVDRSPISMVSHVRDLPR